MGVTWGACQGSRRRAEYDSMDFSGVREMGVGVGVWVMFISFVLYGGPGSMGSCRWSLGGLGSIIPAGCLLPPSFIPHPRARFMYAFHLHPPFSMFSSSAPNAEPRPCRVKRPVGLHVFRDGNENLTGSQPRGG